MKSKVEYIQLSEEPDVGFLQLIAYFSHEVALVKLQSNWFAFAGTEDRVPSFLIPKESQIFIHSHPAGKGSEFPSIGDLNNSHEGTLNCIIGKKGIMLFTPPKRRPIRNTPERPDFAELEAASRQAGKNTKEYKKF